MTTTTKEPSRKPAKVASRGPKRTTRVAQQPAKGPSKADQLWAMLERPNGVSISEVVESMNVLPHSARAMISVLSRKRGKKAVLAEGRYTLQ